MACEKTCICCGKDGASGYTGLCLTCARRMNHGAVKCHDTQMPLLVARVQAHIQKETPDVR